MGAPNQKKDRVEITAKVSKSWFSFAIGQIVFAPRIVRFVFVVRFLSARQRLRDRFPLGMPALDRARAAGMSDDEMWHAARAGCLVDDGHGGVARRHRSIDYGLWAIVMAVLGWAFFALLLPAWRWALPSRHSDLLQMTAVMVGYAFVIHRRLFITQQRAAKAVKLSTEFQ